MHANDLKYFKNILLKMRQEVVRGEDGMYPVGAQKIDNLGDTGGADYTTHLADVGSDTLMLEEQSYYEERSRKFLQHLNAALERVEKGDYGICFGCGEEIPKERLEAVPQTRYCVSCKNRWEE